MAALRAQPEEGGERREAAAVDALAPQFGQRLMRRRQRCHTSCVYNEARIFPKAEAAFYLCVPAPGEQVLCLLASSHWLMGHDPFTFIMKIMLEVLSINQSRHVPSTTIFDLNCLLTMLYLLLHIQLFRVKVMQTTVSTFSPRLTHLGRSKCSHSEPNL